MKNRVKKEKTIFSYTYWGSLEKFELDLPVKDNFYNTLTNCAINEKKYKYVVNVW